MSQHEGQSDLVGEVRFKVPLPIVIPFGALAVIGAGAYGFSRVLLSVEKDAAVAIAIVMAANLLGACWFLATRPKVSGATLAELALVVIYPVIIGLAIAEFGLVGTAEAEHHGATAEAPGGGGGAVSAANVAFSTDSLTFVAGEAKTITFDNEDSQPHNIAIYETADDASAKSNALFQGEVIEGGSSVDYEIGPLEAGEYPFQCDIHPAMAGTAIVE